MSIRKTAHSGKGANTPTQTPTPTETSQPPRFYRVIAYSSAGDVGGIHHGKPHKQPEAYASRYEALQAGSELLHADSNLYAFELERLPVAHLLTPAVLIGHHANGTRITQDAEPSALYADTQAASTAGSALMATGKYCGYTVTSVAGGQS